MCENTILPLKVILIFPERLHVVWVSIHRAGSPEVPDLGDSLLAVAHLLVEEAWLHVTRVDVVIPRDDVVVHRRSIIQGF